MCLVFIGIFRINPILHRVELPNAQFAVSNADTTPSHLNHRNNLHEIITNVKFHPQILEKKHYNAHYHTREFKNKNFECKLESHPKVRFSIVQFAVVECVVCTLKFNLCMRRCFGKISSMIRNG